MLFSGGRGDGPVRQALLVSSSLQQNLILQQAVSQLPAVSSPESLQL